MNEREELKRLVIQNPDVCEKLLEIVQLLISQRHPNPSAAE